MKKKMTKAIVSFVLFAGFIAGLIVISTFVDPPFSVGLIIFAVALAIFGIVGAIASKFVKYVEPPRRKSERKKISIVGQTLALYEWVDSSDDKSTYNHREIHPEDKETFEGVFDEYKWASIRLFDNGKAIYSYVFTDDAEFEIECEFNIVNDKLLLETYIDLPKSARDCEVFEMNDTGLKYLGNRPVDSHERPVRDLPFSMYNNFVRVD